MNSALISSISTLQTGSNISHDHTVTQYKDNNILKTFYLCYLCTFTYIFSMAGPSLVTEYSYFAARLLLQKYLITFCISVVSV